MTTRGHHGLLMGGASAFSPADLSPVLWLNDDSSVTDAGGGACSQWDDISGNNYHFTQGTGASQPAITAGGLNGRRVITFDGSNDYMSSSGATVLTQNKSAFSIFIVANPSVRATSTIARVINFSIGLSSNTSARVQLTSVNSNFRLTQRRLDADSASNNELAHGSKAWRIHHLESSWSTAQSILRIDGGSPNTVATGQGSGSTSNTASTVVEIGGTGSTTGQNSASGIAEVVCFDFILSAGQRGQMETYLNDRWGL